MSELTKKVRLSPEAHAKITHAKVVMFGRRTSEVTYSDTIEALADWAIEANEEVDDGA